MTEVCPIFGCGWEGYNIPELSAHLAGHAWERWEAVKAASKAFELVRRSKS